jgi:hypothetical protein
MEEYEPKISYPEALFAGAFLFLIPDLIEIAMAFLFGDSWFLTDLFAFPGEQLYLYLKGVKGMYALIGNVLELIPFLGDLPLRTIAFIITVWVDHHPKISEKTEMLGKVVKS